MEMKVNRHENTESGPTHFSKFNIFYALSFTTALASLLVAANELRWSRTGDFYRLVTTNRASVQIVIQVLANLLGLIHVTAICRLINYATRIHFRKAAISLNTLRAWVALSEAHMDLDLPILWLLPLILLIAVTLVPSALWAGAITPVLTAAIIQKSLLVPSYGNLSLIDLKTSPFVKNANGLFTYQIEQSYAGNILSDAANANGSDSLHQHTNFDNTRYTYFGRSYGAGAAVGLGDNDISSNLLATQYVYQEAGYSAQVACI